MRLLPALGALAATLTPAGAAVDDTWVVVRDQGNGVCILQPATSRPFEGSRELVEVEGVAAACRAAAALKTDDPGDHTHCFDYAIVTYGKCKGAGVVLPQ